MPLLATAGAASVRGFRPYSTQSAAGFISATGGTVYVDPTAADYKIHEFTSSSTFSITAAPASAAVEVMMVAGGGRGFYAGGGAGGYIYRASLALGAGSYSVSIGAGGVSGADAGGNTTFAGLTAIGGGGANQSGGSGGGGVDANGGAGLQPTSSSGGFGNAGGNWTGSGSDGGGGGAGGTGSVPTGGAGRTADIASSSGTYATFASGGYGNDDSQSYALPVVVANSGNGGWGGGYSGVTLGQDGQAGIVRIRYKFQ